MTSPMDRNDIRIQYETENGRPVVAVYVADQETGKIAAARIPRGNHARAKGSQIYSVARRLPE
ncbi:MAG: hypothetical protein AAF360_10025 [Pseudomonadota bacterium]